MITEAQRKERQNGIGGSDMPIIMGLSNYKTPYQLYLEKTGQSESTDETTELQYWGIQLENVVRKEFAKRHNITVETPETITHPDYSFLRGNMDGYIPAWNAILEVKCTAGWMAHEWGEEGTDVIPMPYLVQVAHYCAVANADCAYIAVLIGGNKYREFKYTRDRELEAMLIKEGIAFWNCVINKTPPAPINQVDLRLLYPKHRPEKTKRIAPVLKTELDNLQATRFQIKKLNELEEKCKFSIMQFMQDAECLVNEDGSPIVSWKANKRGSRTFLVKGV